MALNSRFPSASKRLYPGVHQEQAAQAKALAEAGKETKHQQQPAIVPQKQPHQPAPRANGGSTRPTTDPVTEERISRLLNEMRHNSVASSNDDGATHNANVHQHIARMKREEEEMDEDERLLASEEGKKLSSKERRQLRNKVSARAFRSRRKGMFFVI